jgi:hypothetical protein
MQYRALEDAEVRACISMLAARLEVSEYELFCRAYESFSGQPPRADMERLAGAYIMSSRVPRWMRHFARLNSHGAGTGRCGATCGGVPYPATQSRHEPDAGSFYSQVFASGDCVSGLKDKGATSLPA